MTRRSGVLASTAMNGARSIVLALLLAVACSSKPLPPDRVEYAGHWKGPGIDLVITAEGRASYDKRSGATTVHVDGPIQGFSGDDFVVGVMVVRTKFVVAKPPTDNGGVWTMTVDGIELVRQ